MCGGDCAADADADGICDDVDDCVGELDACGVCNGPGEIYECGCSDIPAGDCDCDGNQLDALGVCGGDCAADADADGICDDVDDCVGALDACGVCNGPGEIYECGCSDIPAGDCDCDGNQLDALGVCGGDCAADADADGICDDVDDCVGELDACGVCNGPGEIYECGCSDIPAGDCDCDGNQLDSLGVCGGDCAADADADGICDDVDDCVGELDACGVCNGPGEAYECGCADIPEGDCDCDGNQFDALGVCGGDCAADADADGICDDVDDCVGELDACGVCNGPGEIYECGCADIPEGDCDCDGNQLDACGVCGGSGVDADMDGICDDVDDCVGAFDDCGVCNGDNSSCTGCADSAACNYDEPPSTTDHACTWTLAACAVVRVWMPTWTAFAMTWTTVSAPLTHVACAMVLARFTSADALTSQKGTATATATKTMRWATVVEAVRPTRMATASVTVKSWDAPTPRLATTTLRPLLMTTLVWSWTLAVFVVDPVRFMNVDARTFQKAIVTATATSSTPSAFVAVIARQTKTWTAFVTT